MIYNNVTKAEFIRRPNRFIAEVEIDGVFEVRANRETHPEFGTALDEAEKEGVEIRFFRCHVTPESLTVI